MEVNGGLILNYKKKPERPCVWFPKRNNKKIKVRSYLNGYFILFVCADEMLVLFPSTKKVREKAEYLICSLASETMQVKPPVLTICSCFHACLVVLYVSVFFFFRLTALSSGQSQHPFLPDHRLRNLN